MTLLTERVEILTPTDLEYWTVRAVHPRGIVTKTGIGLRSWTRRDGFGISLLCGLAGGLIDGLEPGTVFVPELVRAEGGTVVRCDAEIREALVRAARSLGFNPETGPLLTARTIVTGTMRREWAMRGFVAADMEAALAAEAGGRFATVRVILDTPRRSLSDRWGDPRKAISMPALWPELFWLVGAAPIYALRAARVVRAGLELWQRG